MAYDGTRPDGNQALRGSYKAAKWMVLDEWYESPLKINRGNDMGLVILERDHDGNFPGQRSLPLRFCYDNCYIPDVQIDLVSYPADYSFGNIMVRTGANAFKLDDGGYDYHFGTGVREGSSGGPIIMVSWTEEGGVVVLVVIVVVAVGITP